MEVKVIGQMDNTMDHTFESANRVYDVNGIAPTMNTCGGGGLQPKIIVQQPVCINSKGGRSGIEGLQPSLQDRVYRTDAVSVAVTTSFMPSILEEKTIVAMRGRNPDNPSDRTPGAPTEQRLEPNSQGICNTLTSVQKDNLVLENVVIGGMRAHQSIKNDGVCTCLVASMGTGGGYVPMIPETVKIKNNNAKGYEECVVGGVADFLYPSSTTRRGRVQENGNVSPTLTSENSGVCRIEKVGQISSDGSQYGTVVGENGLSATLAAGTHGYANSCIQQQYRIRKLTPKECWRLMGFSDEDFHKAEKVNSNTQLYKQAGNSIVVDVLEAIFSNLF